VSSDTIDGKEIKTLLYPYSIDIVNDSIIFTARKWPRNKEYRGGLTDEQQLKIKEMVSVLNQKYEIPSMGMELAPWACILEIDNQVHYIQGDCEDDLEKMPEEIQILFRYIIDLSPIVPMGFGQRPPKKKNNSDTTIAHQKGTFTDTRDGKIYKTTKIGEQVWMAENLNYEAKGSKCYNDSTAYCNKYGRLYNWETAMKACPNDWHLPSKAEWGVLINTIGIYRIAGKFLKSTSGWNSYNGGKYSGNGDDKYDFSALPGGFGKSDGYFSIGEIGLWWSASEYRNGITGIRIMEYSEVDYYPYNKDNKDFLLSVRCLQD
jgi:uncharacterized protein (TIGR02145 family)